MNRPEALKGAEILARDNQRLGSQAIFTSRSDGIRMTGHRPWLDWFSICLGPMGARAVGPWPPYRSWAPDLSVQPPGRNDIAVPSAAWLGANGSGRTSICSHTSSAQVNRASGSSPSPRTTCRQCPHTGRSMQVREGWKYRHAPHCRSLVISCPFHTDRGPWYTADQNSRPLRMTWSNHSHCYSKGVQSGPNVGAKKKTSLKKR